MSPTFCKQHFAYLQTELNAVNIDVTLHQLKRLTEYKDDTLPGSHSKSPHYPNNG